MNSFKEGTIHSSRKYGTFTITGFIDRNHRQITFTATGYTTITSLGNISSGNIKDRYSPSVKGIGYLGGVTLPKSHPRYRTLYRQWTRQLSKPSPIVCFAEFIADTEA